MPKFGCYKLLKKISFSKQQWRKHPLQSIHNLPKFNCILQSIRVLKLFRKEAGRTQSSNHCFPLALTAEVAELFQLTFLKGKKKKKLRPIAKCTLDKISIEIVKLVLNFTAKQ